MGRGEEAYDPSVPCVEVMAWCSLTLMVLVCGSCLPYVARESLSAMVNTFTYLSCLPIIASYLAHILHTFTSSLTTCRCVCPNTSGFCSPDLWMCPHSCLSRMTALSQWEAALTWLKSDGLLLCVVVHSGDLVVGSDQVDHVCFAS